MKPTTGSTWYDPKTGDMYARVTYTKSDGKRCDRKRKAIPQTKSRVTQLLKEMIREMDDAGPQALDTTRVTFKQLADHCVEHHFVEAVYVGGKKIHGLRSVKVCLYLLKPIKEFFGNMMIRDISHETITRYKLKRLRTQIEFRNKAGELTGTRTRGVAGVQRELSVLRSMMNIAIAQRPPWILRDANPFVDGAKLIVPDDEIMRERILTDEEERRVLAACGADEKRKHLTAIITLALDTGMRRGEILSLTWDDVDMPGHCINLRGFDEEAQRGNTKNMRGRPVPLSSRVEAILNGMEITGKRLFPITTFQTSWTKTRRDAGIEDVHFHDLRHTFATRLLSAGMPEIYVSRFLGHSASRSGSRMTGRYINMTPEIIERARTMLDTLNRQRFSDSGISTQPADVAVYTHSM